MMDWQRWESWESEEHIQSKNQAGIDQPVVLNIRQFYYYY